MPPHVQSTIFRGRAAVQIGNDRVLLTVLTGGGHIAAVQIPGDALATDSSADYGSPLWYARSLHLLAAHMLPPNPGAFLAQSSASYVLQATAMAHLRPSGGRVG